MCEFFDEKKYSWNDLYLAKQMFDVLAEEFNREAKDYFESEEVECDFHYGDFNDDCIRCYISSFDSKLGSCGKVEEREVCRDYWYNYVCNKLNLNKDNYYYLTDIIEMMYDGIQLETGKIYFGS